MREKASEVERGFWRAGAWLFAIGWLFLVFAGMAIVTTPGRLPSIFGWIFLAVAAVMAFLTVDRWVRAFPALLAYGILGSVLTLVDGHAVNHPEVRVSQLEAAVMLVFFIVAAVLSLTFAKRKLLVTDRVALLAFIFCFFLQAAIPSVTWVSIGIGLCFLLLASLYERFGISSVR